MVFTLARILFYIALVFGETIAIHVVVVLPGSVYNLEVEGLQSDDPSGKHTLQLFENVLAKSGLHVCNYRKESACEYMKRCIVFSTASGSMLLFAVLTLRDAWACKSIGNDFRHYLSSFFFLVLQHLSYSDVTSIGA